MIQKSIEEIATEIETTIKGFSDSDARWKWLLEISKKQPRLDPSLLDDRFLIHGCASRLYLIPKFENGKIWFDTDSDDSSSLISRGLASLAIRLFSGQTPADILSFDTEFFRKVGLYNSLSPSRANGFSSLLRQIRLYALVYENRNEITRPDKES